MENKETTLAIEILQELKASARRWFIIAICELFLLLALAGGFIWYISLPVDDVTVESDEQLEAEAVAVVNVGERNV